MNTEKLNSHRFTVNAKKNIETALLKKYKILQMEFKVCKSVFVQKPVFVYFYVHLKSIDKNYLGGHSEKTAIGKTLKTALNYILKDFNQFYNANATIYDEIKTENDK